MEEKLRSFRDILSRVSKVESRTGTISFPNRLSQEHHEKVERKGIGHPDTLADALATAICRSYCSYTVERFGLILNHNFDKFGFMGGRTKVDLGGGEVTSPIRILLNGRASGCFGNERIPVRDIFETATRELMTSRFPMLEFDKDCKVMWEVRDDSTSGEVMNDDSPSRRPFWYRPRSAQDVEYIQEYIANDMSTGFGYSPMNPLAKLVLDLEKYLSSDLYKRDKPWLGSDIKTTAVRDYSRVFISIVVPQICGHVASVADYSSNLERVREDIVSFSTARQADWNFDIAINTRDRLDRGGLELYLTHTGSCVEMGDEGFVGRGNRANGVIEMYRPYSMEAPCGKNPAYSIGFVYTEAAQRISERLMKDLGLKTEVSLTSQNARKILDPWHISIASEFGMELPREEVTSLVHSELDRIPDIPIDFIEGKITPY